VDDTYAGVAASKVDVLLERLAEVIEEGHRALVFSQFTGFLATVRARLDAEGSPTPTSTGAPGTGPHGWRRSAPATTRCS
jgi:hypothetical protein